MDVAQGGGLMIAAMLFTFVVCPIAVWAGFHYQHLLEPHDDDAHHQ